MSDYFKVLLTLIISFLSIGANAQVSTDITVRVLSKDAKFIGTGVGGAKITIIDLSTGDTLSTGLTSGSTGNTSKLISEDQVRYKKLSEEGDASYMTTLELGRPVKARVIAEAPLSGSAANYSTSQDIWLIPGKHISGDGLVLELFGLTVKIMEPIQFLAEEDLLEIKSEVTMLCGCPTMPEGLWDSSKMEIEAWVYSSGKLLMKSEMKYTGDTSMYNTKLKLKRSGEYQIYVIAFDPRTGNTGLDTVLISY